MTIEETQDLIDDDSTNPEAILKLVEQTAAIGPNEATAAIRTEILQALAGIEWNDASVCMTMAKAAVSAGPGQLRDEIGKCIITSFKGQNWGDSTTNELFYAAIKVLLTSRPVATTSEPPTVTPESPTELHQQQAR